MSDVKKTKQDYEKEYGYSHEESLRHWRAWGSWFSWGSPVGLGLFFLCAAGAIWIIAQI